MNKNTAEQNGSETLPAAAKLMAFYLSRDRVLSLIDTDKLPPLHLQALQGVDVPMATAILTNAVGAHFLQAIASSGVRTL